MKNKNVALIYMGAFLLSFSYGVLLFLPLFVNHLGGNPLVTGWLLAIGGTGTILAVIASKFWFRKLAGKFIAALGGLAYTIGAICFLFSHSIGTLIIIASLFAGIGWGLYYNAAPFILSFFTTSENRSMFFSYLSAFSVLGTGIAPVLVKFIWGGNISFSIIFSMAALTCILSSLSFLCVKKNILPASSQIQHHSEKTIHAIVIGVAKYPVIMVFLGACAFTMMLNFQTTYANSIGMNYAYFYIIYSLAVVFSRLMLGKFLTRFNQYKLSIFLLSIMVISLLSFLFSGANQYLYGISSALFGLSYGLIYPTIQAIAVNSVSEHQRSDIISYFSLSYFIGVYAFPPLGGFLIVHLGYSSLLLAISLLAGIELVVSVLLYFRMKNRSAV